MDVQDPGANLPGIPELGGILRLGGALRAPLELLTQSERAERSPGSRNGPSRTRRLPDRAGGAGEPRRRLPHASSSGRPACRRDPLIVPPIYGRWHSASRLVP